MTGREKCPRCGHYHYKSGDGCYTIVCDYRYARARGGNPFQPARVYNCECARDKAREP